MEERRLRHCGYILSDAEEELKSRITEKLQSVDDSKTEQFGKMLKYQFNPGQSRADRDPIVQLVLRHSEGHPPSNEAIQKILPQFCRNFALYDFFLGSLIPESLAIEARKAIATMKYDHGENLNVAQDLPEFLTRLQKRKSLRPGFPTGIATIDEKLFGGFRDLTMLLGDKGIGKTWYTINVALENLKTERDTAVLYYALDSRRSEIIDRTICKELRLSYRELCDSDPSELKARPEWNPYAEKMGRMQIVERSRYNRSLTDQDIYDAALNLANRSKVPRVLIVIDLFQKMIVEESISPNQYDRHRLDQINLALAQLSEKLGEGNVAVLATSEMRKRERISGGGAPTREDIKGDGRIASDASCIMILSSTEEVNLNSNIVTLNIDKGRDGVERGNVQLTFDHRLGSFEASRLQRTRSEQSGATQTTSLFDEE